MAKLIINLLETIEINKDNPDAKPMTIRLVDSIPEFQDQRVAVGRTGKCIMRGLIGELMFTFFSFRDVSYHGVRCRLPIVYHSHTSD